MPWLPVFVVQVVTAVKPVHFRLNCSHVVLVLTDVGLDGQAVDVTAADDPAHDLSPALTVNTVRRLVDQRSEGLLAQPREYQPSTRAGFHGHVQPLLSAAE